MEEINAKWLKSRIGDDRGLRAELARQTGISADKISKILSGVRQVKASEAPLIYRFFNQEPADLEDPEWQELRHLWKQLSPEERIFLRNSAKAQIEARDLVRKQSREAD